MKEGSIALLALGLAAATAGLVFWGHSRAKDPPGSPLSPAGGVAGQFPGLRLNDVLLVDTTAAKLPGPFNVSEQATMIVDMILSDPFVVSARIGVRGVPGVPFFSGTIPKSAILRVIASPGADLQA